MWATAPFLHNGSVPSLYELLLPAAQRSKTFRVGRAFDPVKVGVDTTEANAFLLDTALPGNSNAGHSFEEGPKGSGVIGRLLTDDERCAAALALTSALPERAFTGEYDRLFGSDDETKTEMEIES